jgi:hypothetical protein
MVATGESGRPAAGSHGAALGNRRPTNAVARPAPAKLVLTHCRTRFPISLVLRAFWVVAVWSVLPAGLGVLLIYGAYQAVLPPIPDIMAHAATAQSSSRCTRSAGV